MPPFTPFFTEYIYQHLRKLHRERRHFRNNLRSRWWLLTRRTWRPLQYLMSYFLSEINAWDVQLSTEWEKMCLLN